MRTFAYLMYGVDLIPYDLRGMPRCASKRLASRGSTFLEGFVGTATERPMCEQRPIGGLSKPSNHITVGEFLGALLYPKGRAVTHKLQ